MACSFSPFKEEKEPSSFDSPYTLLSFQSTLLLKKRKNLNLQTITRSYFRFNPLSF
ncbi:hypothetical protein LEP1GSC046_1787 [Leptospira kirschneri serovar Bim str. 1051]|nr:hypothetical protein LEP1GSC046_1787 [Leptospira kirschneri serovar Bim str. 1051]